MEKTITLTLEQARELYKNGGEDIKNFLLTNFNENDLKEKVYPKTWLECLEKKSETGVFYVKYDGTVDRQDYINPYTNPKAYQSLPSAKTAKQILALSQLLICRDVWRNGWEPKIGEKGYYIYVEVDCNRCDKYNIWETTGYKRAFSFPTKEIAENFLNTFKNLIKTAGDLI